MRNTRVVGFAGWPSFWWLAALCTVLHLCPHSTTPSWSLPPLLKPPSYEFGVVINGQPSPLLIDLASTFKFSNLARGASTLYVRAVDGQGAAITVTRAVIVRDPPAGFNASATIASIDVTRAAATGDPAALNQAAMAIASLAQVSGAVDRKAVN
jgi:hypothetical protein